MKVDKKSVDASVIVPSHDRPTMLNDLLHSLGDMEVLPREVVIVDDASEIEVKSSVNVDEYPFRIKIARNNKPEGPARSRNIGVQLTRGDILAFTDDDCIVDKGWLGALVNGLKSSEEFLAGVGGNVYAYEKDVFSRYYEHNKILEPRPHDKKHPKRVPYLVTANCAVKRDVFMRAGGFDENIKKAGGDDCAMSLKIIKIGYYFEREENAIVWHRFRKGFRSLYRTFFWYGVGGRYVVDRYLPL